MPRTKRTVFYRAVVLMVILGTCALLPSSVLAQGAIPSMPFGGAGESFDSENSRLPFQFKLGGILNPTTPDTNSLAIITLAVGTYREIYKFEVRTAEAPDYPKMSTNQVLKSLGKYIVQIHLMGDRELLSKVGQSLPDTPITMVGLFTRRYRQLQILSVDMFSLDGHP